MLLVIQIAVGVFLGKVAWSFLNGCVKGYREMIEELEQDKNEGKEEN